LKLDDFVSEEGHTTTAGFNGIAIRPESNSKIIFRLKDFGAQHRHP
jgi:hypothetical protein